MEELLYYKRHSCQENVIFLSTYSNKKASRHGPNQIHISNIAARYEVPTTSGNTFLKDCM